MKGVILVAGHATRLQPLTNVVGKALLPVYNKPMIYYSVSLLIECGITDILIISNNSDINTFKQLFDNKFANFGINISFAVQQQALGTAHAITYAKDFVGQSDFVLVYGDNIFCGQNIASTIKKGIAKNTGVTLFTTRVSNPQAFGVVELDGNKQPKSIVEKPTNSTSNLAITGLFIFKNDVFNLFSKLKKSVRGEYELTDYHKLYLQQNRVRVETLNSRVKWLDTGTPSTLLQSGNIVKNFEQKVEPLGCVELSLLKQGLITKQQIKELCTNRNSNYYLTLLNEINKI